ncbi:hypothetical protein SEA_KARDASHIAN_37 [Streptomyces phage Kardashian]|nr:hypothetical protein SEA_KARDASHIAN_37 [Streptomyces phage Kardashian]
MDFAEFVQKTNAIADKARETTDPKIRQELNYDMIDIGIEMFNEHCAGTVRLADGSTVTVVEL